MLECRPSDADKQGNPTWMVYDDELYIGYISYSMSCGQYCFWPKPMKYLLFSADLRLLADYCEARTRGHGRHKHQQELLRKNAPEIWRVLEDMVALDDYVPTECQAAVRQARVLVSRLRKELELGEGQPNQR